MKVIYIIALCLYCSITYAQETRVILDSKTKERIPFVNIWLENESQGTTSNKNGEFNFQKSLNGKTLVFSSIGYENKRISYTQLNDTIFLQPIVYQLSEVTIKPQKRKKNTVGKFKKAGISYYFACGGAPWIVARYFSKKEFEETPYIESIKFLTNSDIKEAAFSIRFYKPDSNLMPKDYLISKNIVATAKKGKKITTVDVSEYNIEIPSNGIFIAVEWLIIEENKYINSFKDAQTQLATTRVSYEPSFGMLPKTSSANSWVFTRGKWENTWKAHSHQKKYEGKYLILALELTTTN